MWDKWGKGSITNKRAFVWSSKHVLLFHLLVVQLYISSSALVKKIIYKVCTFDVSRCLQRSSRSELKHSKVLAGKQGLLPCWQIHTPVLLILFRWQPLVASNSHHQPECYVDVWPPCVLCSRCTWRGQLLSLHQRARFPNSVPPSRHLPRTAASVRCSAVPGHGPPTCGHCQHLSGGSQWSFFNLWLIYFPPVRCRSQITSSGSRGFFTLTEVNAVLACIEQVYHCGFDRNLLSHSCLVSYVSANDSQKPQETYTCKI